MYIFFIVVNFFGNIHKKVVGCNKNLQNMNRAFKISMRSNAMMNFFSL